MSELFDTDGAAGLTAGLESGIANAMIAPGTSSGFGGGGGGGF